MSLSSALGRLLLLPLAASQPQVMIQFEPMEAAEAPQPHELFSMLAGPGSSVQQSGSAHLGSLFDEILGGGGFPMQRRRQRRGREDPDEGDFLVVQGGPSDFMNSLALNDRSSVPAMEFQQLFPVSPQSIDIEVDPIDDASDVVLNDMLKHVTKTFKKTMLPSIRRAVGSGSPPDACKSDAQSKCKNATSQLHCLGQHGDQLSESCRRNIGKSVPFLCSSSIDKFCNVLDIGILPCLADHLGDLDSSCRDAVTATHRLIVKVNAQKASITDPSTGEETVHKPVAPEEDALMQPVSIQRPGVKLTLVPPSPPRRGLASAEAPMSSLSKTLPELTAEKNRAMFGSRFQIAMVLAGICAGAYFFKLQSSAKPKGPSLMGHETEMGDGSHLL